MTVASHLRIRVAEYDRKISTFIPYYREMLTVAAAALQPRLSSPLIVDLGTGTGALAKLCLQAVPSGRLIGLDTDSEMLAVATRRLRATQRPGVELKQKCFTRGALPRANYITAAFSLHHIRTRGLKVRLYQRCLEALYAGGTMVSVMVPTSVSKRPITDCSSSRSTGSVRDATASSSQAAKVGSRIAAQR